MLDWCLSLAGRERIWALRLVSTGGQAPSTYGGQAALERLLPKASPDLFHNYARASDL